MENLLTVFLFTMSVIIGTCLLKFICFNGPFDKEQPVLSWCVSCILTIPIGMLIFIAIRSVINFSPQIFVIAATVTFCIFVFNLIKFWYCKHQEILPKTLPIKQINNPINTEPIKRSVYELFND